MEFKLSGIGIGMDLAIFVAILAFFVSARKDRRDRVDREKAANLSAISDHYQPLNALTDAMFAAIRAGSPNIHSVHDQIWTFLNAFELKSALISTPRFHRRLVWCKRSYRIAMAERKNPKLGITVLAAFFGSMITEMQGPEIANIYVQDRFDMSLDALNEALRTERLSMD